MPASGATDEGSQRPGELGVGFKAVPDNEVDASITAGLSGPPPAGAHFRCGAALLACDTGLLARRDVSMVSRLAPCPGKHDSDASDNDRDEHVQDWDYFVRTHTRTVSATSDDDVTRAGSVAR
jgi:hypothetical protein